LAGVDAGREAQWSLRKLAIDHCMMIPIKTALEIDRMRASCKLASNILEALSGVLCPGITTKDVDQAGAKLMAEAGCKSAFLGYRRFPGNICISVNDEVVHGIGGSRRIQYGDIVKARHRCRPWWICWRHSSHHLCRRRKRWCAKASECHPKKRSTKESKKPGMAGGLANFVQRSRMRSSQMGSSVVREFVGPE